MFSGHGLAHGAAKARAWSLPKSRRWNSSGMTARRAGFRLRAHAQRGAPYAAPPRSSCAPRAAPPQAPCGTAPAARAQRREARRSRGLCSSGATPGPPQTRAPQLMHLSRGLESASAALDQRTWQIIRSAAAPPQAHRRTVGTWGVPVAARPAPWRVGHWGGDSERGECMWWAPPAAG